MRIAIWLFVVIIVAAIAVGYGSAYMIPMKKESSNDESESE